MSTSEVRACEFRVGTQGVVSVRLPSEGDGPTLGLIPNTTLEDAAALGWEPAAWPDAKGVCGFPVVVMRRTNSEPPPVPIEPDPSWLDTEFSGTRH